MKFRIEVLASEITQYIKDESGKIQAIETKFNQIYSIDDIIILGNK